ncbi:protein SRC2, partial [Tanacetum coccineum]
MAARYELEVTVTSAKNLKNVNWRHGPLKPYAVVWVDPKNKSTTRVDETGDESPIWDQKLVIPFNDPIDESSLYIDIVHAYPDEDTKPLIGSAKLKLKDVVDDVGLGQLYTDSLKLKRPSGRPHGKVEVKVLVKDPRYQARDPYYPPPGYPYAPYGGPPQYGQPGYVGEQPSYGAYKEEKKSSKYGMGTGLAVGAAAGLLGGLAIAEGVDYVEDHIADDAADKVEDDLGYDVDD